MSIHSNTSLDPQNYLGTDSNYEFIDTDTESHDDNATESIASTDYNGAEDVHSLDGTECSENDSDPDDDSEQSPMPTFTGLDEYTETPTLGRSKSAFIEASDRPLSSSIEFKESFGLGTEHVCVKHTICDFDEADATSIAKKIKLSSVPARLMATVHQTMTKQSLSTKEPLRILYVGSDSAKHDIIHKIASAVAASNKISTRASKLFNVLPISAFGSDKVPEVELMHSSEYQINVEVCSGATHYGFEDNCERPDVLELTIEDNMIPYRSAEDGGAFIVEPDWELPHVAIFYCADTDTSEAVKTRRAATEFMARHDVPSIIISHEQTFENLTTDMPLNRHALHMCLESRGHDGSSTVLCRLPIDLASFDNIDARQMNRNLAYLTGLYEPDITSPTVMRTQQGVEMDWKDIEDTSAFITKCYRYIRSRSGAQWLRALRSVLPVVILFAGLYSSNIVSNLARSSSSTLVQINGNAPSHLHTACAKSSTVANVQHVISTRSTRTTTQTITVVRTPHATSKGLSVVSQADILKAPGNVAKESVVGEKDGKKMICSAEAIGDREILVRVPSSTLNSWFGKEAMSVNVTRGVEAVQTERAYFTVDGIILLFSRREAYGVMNISIITTKKPRINETCSVDLGSSWSHEAEDVLTKLMATARRLRETPVSPQAFLKSAMTDIQSLTKSTMSQLGVLKYQAAQKKAQIAMKPCRLCDSVKHLTKTIARDSKLVNTRINHDLAVLKDRFERKYEKVVENAETSLIKAQISSKLAYLRAMDKMSKKQDRHREYKKKAGELMQRRSKNMKKSRDPRKTGVKWL